MSDPYALPSPAVFNLRDLGGRPTVDGGRTAADRFYRSGELAEPAAAADPVLAGLRLATVVDLRTAREVAVRPDHLPAGAAYLHLDVLADLPAQAAAEQAQLISDPGAFAEQLSRYDPVGQMVATYRDLVAADAARAGYAAFVRAVLAADGAPVLVHCTAGKDRTGWAATVLLLAAGVEPDAVRAEYLAVNPAVLAAFGPLLDQLTAAGGDRAMIEPLLEVRAQYLDVALAELAGFGGFDGYLSDGLGLADDEVAGLRALLRA